MKTDGLITGTIVSEPRMEAGRVMFGLQLADQQVVPCMSGAGTSFLASQFPLHGHATLLGEHKSDMLFGETADFVFSQVAK